MLLCFLVTVLLSEYFERNIEIILIVRDVLESAFMKMFLMFIPLVR